MSRKLYSKALGIKKVVSLDRRQGGSLVLLSESPVVPAKLYTTCLVKPNCDFNVQTSGGSCHSQTYEQPPQTGHPSPQGRRRCSTDWRALMLAGRLLQRYCASQSNDSLPQCDSRAVGASPSCMRMRNVPEAAIGYAGTRRCSVASFPTLPAARSLSKSCVFRIRSAPMHCCGYPRRMLNEVLWSEAD